LGRLAVQPSAASSRRLRWLGAQSIAGVLEQAVEQMLGPDPGVALPAGEAGGDLGGAFGEDVDALWAGDGGVRGRWPPGRVE
jgi:hypothetical protein